jgi:hypothetical protein
MDLLVGCLVVINIVTITTGLSAFFYFRRLRREIDPPPAVSFIHPQKTSKVKRKSPTWHSDETLWHKEIEEKKRESSLI